MLFNSGKADHAFAELVQMTQQGQSFDAEVYKKMKDFNRLSMCAYLDEVMKCPMAIQDIEDPDIQGPCDTIQEAEDEETLTIDVEKPLKKSKDDSLTLSSSNLGKSKKFPVKPRDCFVEAFKQGLISD